MNLPKLNLPEYAFKTKLDNGKPVIFDGIRKKYVMLTPEEWVRQHFVQFLKNEKNYPESLMAVEKKVVVNGHPRRFDLLIYKRNGQPHLIAEFKAPGVKISQQTFDQVVRYNMALRVDRVVVSNGLQHFACQINYDENSYAFLREIPGFQGARTGGK